MNMNSRLDVWFFEAIWVFMTSLVFSYPLFSKHASFPKNAGDSYAIRILWKDFDLCPHCSKMENKRIRVKYCEFDGCHNSSSNSKVNFFNFRRHDYSNWIELCNKKELRNLSVSNIVSHRYVCSQHFKRTDFTRPISPYKTKLTKTAVPNSVDFVYGPMSPSG